MQPITATKEQRFITYLIDVIPAFFVSILFGWIPILGAIVVGMVLGSYWLLHDATGGWACPDSTETSGKADRFPDS